MRPSVERSCSISYMFPFVNTFFESFLNFFNIFSFFFQIIQNTPYTEKWEPKRTVYRYIIFRFFSFFFVFSSFFKKFSKNLFKNFKKFFIFLKFFQKSYLILNIQIAVKSISSSNPSQKIYTQN